MFKRLFSRPSLNPTLIQMAPGQVLIKVTEEFLNKLMTRTLDGQVMSVEMGNIKPDGTHEPTIRVEDDGKVVVDRFVLDEWRVLKAGKPGKKGSGLVAVEGGKITPVQ